MARLYALLGTAHGLGQAIVNAIPGMTYHAGGIRGQRVEFRRNGKRLVCLLLDVAKDYDLGPVSASPAGDWDVWLLVADSRNDSEADKWLPRVYRHLRRRGDANPGYLFGPVSLKEAKGRWPAKVADLLEDGAGNWAYPSLAGDSLDACAEEDYRPSQSDIDNDVDE